MVATVAERAVSADLRALSDDDLAALYLASDEDAQAAILAECAWRDAAGDDSEPAEPVAEPAPGTPADKSRAAARERNAEWEAAAYAQYMAADERCRGFLLSEAGKRTGRDPWPMLWQGGRETADKLASDDLITFWDYESPRVTPPAEYAAAKREADAEQEARHHDAQGTEPEPEPRPKARPKRPRRKAAQWIGCPGGAVRETPVKIGDLTVTAWAAMAFDSDAITIHPTREHAERHLVPPPPPESAPQCPDLTAMTDPAATTAERMVCIGDFGDYLEQQRKASAERMASIRERVALLATRKGTNR